MIPLLYVDPGSGSYILQILIAGIISVIIFFRNIKLYVKTFFYRLFKKKADHDGNKDLTPSAGKKSR